MIVGETIDLLSKTDDYLGERLKTSDRYMDMIKTILPDSYKEIQEKEEAFLEVRKILGG